MLLQVVSEEPSLSNMTAYKAQGVGKVCFVSIPDAEITSEKHMKPYISKYSFCLYKDGRVETDFVLYENDECHNISLFLRYSRNDLGLVLYRN